MCHISFWTATTRTEIEPSPTTVEEIEVEATTVEEVIIVPTTSHEPTIEATTQVEIAMPTTRGKCEQSCSVSLQKSTGIWRHFPNIQWWWLYYYANRFFSEIPFYSFVKLMIGETILL